MNVCGTAYRGMKLLVKTPKTLSQGTEGETNSMRVGKIGLRLLVLAMVVVTAVGAIVFLQGDVRTSAQETPNCEVIDLGTLGSDSDGGLSTEGRWSTEDCDSSFHVESDAHNYRFAVAAAGRIRIDLKSSDADAFLYLLDGMATGSLTTTMGAETSMLGLNAIWRLGVICWKLRLWVAADRARRISACRSTGSKDVNRSTSDRSNWART